MRWALRTSGPHVWVLMARHGSSPWQLDSFVGFLHHRRRIDHDFELNRWIRSYESTR